MASPTLYRLAIRGCVIGPAWGMERLVKGTMGDVLLDSSDRFDPARVLLADIDGSGTSDVIYVGGDGVGLYFNACGNTLSAPTRLEVFRRCQRHPGVNVDLMNDSAACLVWSSSLPTDAAAPLRYVELMADGKPHLMIGTCNNLGAQTRIHYSTSGAMALRDELVGKPWRIRVSFSPCGGRGRDD